LRGRPVLIDTLSLRQAVEGEPWTAYGQFCRHFLAPLALMGLKDIIQAFVQFREEVITRRSKFELAKARERAHILIGLVIAVANLDEVVRIIRAAASPAAAREALLARDWDSAEIDPYLKLVEGEDTTIIEDQVAALDMVSVETPKMVSQHRVVVDGKEWLMAEIRCRSFSAEDVEAMALRSQFDLLASEVLSQISPQGLLEPMARMNQPCRLSLTESELADKAGRAREQVAYLACHAGPIYDFSLLLFADPRLSRLAGCSEKVFFNRLAGFRYYPNPEEDSGMSENDEGGSGAVWSVEPEN
jgi:hypothetical protein